MRSDTSVETILQQHALGNKINVWLVLKDVISWIPLLDTATQIEEGLWLLHHGNKAKGVFTLVMAVPSFIGNVSLVGGLAEKGLARLGTTGVNAALKEGESAALHTASISKRAGQWPDTGVARFDQKAVESSAWEGWTANLKRRGIQVVPNLELPAGNPGNYIPSTRVLEYNAETFRYIDLLHESGHIAQFERAAAKGLDLQAPFRSGRLYGWLEKGALDYEMDLARRFDFSGEYKAAIQNSLDMFWKAGYRKKALVGQRGSSAAVRAGGISDPRSSSKAAWFSCGMNGARR